MRLILSLLVIFIASYRRSGWFDALLDTFWAALPDRHQYPYVNGVKASRSQIRLANELGTPFINYKVGARYIDVAFPGEKLAVEYNGAKFHPNKQQDIDRAKELTKRGWRVLIIQVKDGYPDVRWVQQQIKRLKNYKRKKILYVEWNK